MKSVINRITRVVHILTALQSGEKYCIADLTKMLGMTERTIYRDLKELRNIGVPYHYDRKAKGYSIDPKFFLPPLHLTPEEALSLLALTHRIASQIQQPLKRHAIQAALKIENNLPFEIRNYCHSAIQTISAKASAQAPINTLDSIFIQLQRAIKKKQKVNLIYNSLYESKVIETQLSPYHLRYNKRAWYVMGFSNFHKSIRTFKLNRIQKLQISDKLYIKDNKFNVQDYLGNAWEIIPENRIYHVKLRFLSKVATNVSEVHWHSTQKITHNPDGSVTLEFRVDGLGEISWWVIGYGDQVQILAPKALRKKVLNMAKGLIKLNQQL